MYPKGLADVIVSKCPVFTAVCSVLHPEKKRADGNHLKNVFNLSCSNDTQYITKQERTSNCVSESELRILSGCQTHDVCEL